LSKARFSFFNEQIVLDRKYYVWASEDEPYATSGPYEGDPEVEQAIFLDTNSISCYASRLGNYIFAGLPEMQYQMLGSFYGGF